MTGEVVENEALAPIAVLPPQPARPGRSIGGVIRLALGADVARLIGADPVARLGEDTEGVHQARVASRRLRSHLSTYHDVLREGPARQLSKDLKWLGRALGAVRDLDVLRERIARAVKSIDPLARSEGLQLLGLVDEARAHEAVALSVVLRAERYRALLAALGSAVASPPFRDGAGLPAEHFLHGAIGARYAMLRDAIDALPPAPTDPELHEVRILAKPVRYASEAGADVLASPCGRFAKRVTELCDVLGDLNDGSRVSLWLDQAAAETGRAATVARVRTVEIAKMADARGAWPVAWARVRETAEAMGWDPAAPVPS